MAGANNILQWNPGKANQKNDADWLTDPQRLAGAISGPSVFPSLTANKLLYQLSTMIAAFGNMLATKGYVISDADISVLAGTLANVVTVADFFNTDVGIADAYQVNVNSPTGMPIYFLAAHSNTGACTLTTNTVSTKAVKSFSKISGLIDPVAHQIQAGQLVGVVYDGTEFQIISSSGGGGMLQRVFFGTSGTYVVPPEVTALWVSGCAGAGGGGTAGGGGGGGGAAAHRVPFSVTPGETITITIGAGGAGGVGGNGSDGGDTVLVGSFGTYTIPGGKHGGGGAYGFGGDGGLNPGSGAVYTVKAAGDAYEIANRICGPGGGNGGNIGNGSGQVPGGKTGWGAGQTYGIGGGGGGGFWGSAVVGADAPSTSGAGGCGGNGGAGFAGGSGRVIFEYWA